MALNGNEKLKIKTVSGFEDEENLVFSPEEMQPYEVAEALESDLILGKTDRQVKKSRRIFGYNDIHSEFRLSFRESMQNQIKGISSLFLLICSLVMYLFRPQEHTYLVLSIILGFIMFFNAFLEFRANLALRLPKKFSSLKAKVVRNGEEIIVDSRTLVPGDVLILEEGSMVPADCRLIDEMGLTVAETHVSGVEGSVSKDSRYISYDGTEAICANMVYAGSIIASGHCSAIVCRIGADTLIRRINSNARDMMPDILKYVSKLCRFVSLGSILASLVLLTLGIFAGTDVTEWFICTLAIGASSLCDSMVSLCSAALGFGARKMAEDGMVIKNYNCIRNLAKTNTIACGKNLAFPPKKIMLTQIYTSGKNHDMAKRPTEDIEELLRLMLICSDIKPIPSAERKQKRKSPEFKGLPLDDAILEYFLDWGRSVGPIHEDCIRMDAEYTLSGDISRMLTLYKGKNTVIVRGAPENIISRCEGYTLDGSDYKLSDYTRKKLISAIEDIARTNSFLVAVACCETEADSLRDINAEQSLIFKGFVSFSGGLNPGVAEAVYRCENAGIETVLNSNDAYYTALNSAKSAGIINDEAQIITAEQIRSCDRGLYISNSPYYKLFLNIDDGEWRDIIKLRREEKRTVTVTAERLNELAVMKEADVSLVPENSCDTLRQTADALLLGKGINLIADGILNAKTICRRIGSVIAYLPAAVIIMLVASLFSAFYDQTPAFRPQEVLFCGIIFNLAFACALAFEPRQVKNIRDGFPFSGNKPIFEDYFYPLLFAAGGGIIMFIISASTQNYGCVVLALSLLLFLHACSIGGRGGMFSTKRFGNKHLYLCGLGALLIIDVLLFTNFGRMVFGYSLPEMSKITVSLVLSVAYFVIAQIARYFLTSQRTHKSTKSKKTSFKKKKKSKKQEIEFDESVLDEDYAEDDEDEEFEEEI